MLVGLYPRVSTQEQAEHGYSIDEQIDRMKNYCIAMGWDIYKIYTDAGFSGASLNRPALQRLIHDAQNKKLDKVLVYKLDRLSRSQKDTLYLIEDVFLENGVDFVSMSEQLDTHSAFGKATIGLLATFSQFERELIRDRMAMGKLQKAKQGRYNGSFVHPIGYDYVNGELKVNDFEAMQVREIFERFIQGDSPKEISDALNEKGFTHKNGQWRRETVRSILSSRLFIGEVKFRGNWYAGQHTSLISPETFEQAQLVKKKRQEDYRVRKNAGRPATLLGGMLICGCCGGHYSKCGPVYKCSSRHKKAPAGIKDPNCKNRNWNIEELDNLVLEQISKLALEPDAYTSDVLEPETDPNKIVYAEIKKIENQISKLIDLYALGGMPKDALQKKINALTEKKEKMEEQIKPPETDTRIQKKEAVAKANSLIPLFQSGNLKETRSIVTELIKKIVIYGDAIKIYWNIV